MTFDSGYENEWIAIQMSQQQYKSIFGRLSMSLQSIPTNKAIIQMTHQNLMDEQFISTSSDSLNTETVSELYLNNNQLTCESTRYLSKQNWTHLTCLKLYQNQIGDKGCKYLSRARFPALTSVWLGDSHISDYGASHLSKATIPALTKITFNENYLLGNLKGLTKADWPALSELNMADNPIRIVNSLSLLLMEWKNLELLSLGKGDMRQKEARSQTKKRRVY